MIDDDFGGLELAPAPYRVVVADPPWRFADKLPGTGRGAHRHYDVMRAEDICRLVLPPIADDAHLFMWRVSSMQREALEVAEAWGFTVKSELVWIKRTSGGAVHFGMGRHVRMSHEVCLIATRGRGAGILNRSQRSIFEHLDDEGGGVFDAAIGRHSEKPKAFYEIVRGLVPGPRVELFARVARPGFDAIGNQLADNPITLEVASA
jgi:N6-adenosine-specific RNA methylase IME4